MNEKRNKAAEFSETKHHVTEKGNLVESVIM